MGAAPLACPRCGATYPETDRFCADCGMPLIELGRESAPPLSDSQRRARKVKPQYVGGDLVKVGWARNQAEAELLQGLLLEEGIPSVQRRTQGFDVPQFLAAGPRDVLVSQAAFSEARELLAGVEATGAGVPSDGAAPSSPARLAAWVLGLAGGAVAIVYGLYELAG